MKLTNENYYTLKANLEYMSCSQFKSFHECESKALAEISGDYERPASTALLVGSYVDSYFEGTLELFKKSHPEITKRDGTLKADYVNAEKMIKRASRDAFFMKLMSGEKQRIMTGVIEDVPFKIKIDSFIEDKLIVDLKTVRDFGRIWDEDRHEKAPFVEYWGYDFQGAIYQEIVYQNTGKHLPFAIAAVTKESEPDIAALYIPQERLDECLALVRALAPRYNKLKKGELEDAGGCGKCGWCKRTRILSEIIDYRDLRE